jgi:hypothetical protein
MWGLGLLRFGLKMGFFVVTARWMYAEVALVAPGALPLIDRGLQKIAIPTHDTWGEHLDAAKQIARRLQADDGNGFFTNTGNSLRPNAGTNPFEKGDLPSVFGSVGDSLGKVTMALEQARS